MSLKDKITAKPLLPAPTPTAVCFGMWIRGRGRHKLPLFHFCNLKVDWLDMISEPLSMFLTTVNSVGGNNFRPLSIYTVLVAVAKQTCPQWLWTGEQIIFCMIHWVFVEIARIFHLKTQFLAYPRSGCNRAGIQCLLACSLQENSKTLSMVKCFT